MAAAGEGEGVASWKLETSEFVTLLEKLINETVHLQNAPPALVPREELAARHVLAALEPYRDVLNVRTIQYTEGRPNLIIEYPALGANPERKCLSFVGSHMDVVPADPASWSHDPFTFRRDGDLLYGRGVTDCLGHVALLTCLFIQLAKLKPVLHIDLFAVLIVDEEAGDSPIGVQELCKQGEFEKMKNGPLIWLDSADCQPNIGSGGVVGWSLTATGKLAHSGFPHTGINAIELAMDALSVIQKAFYQHFPPHAKQPEYGYGCSSSMKATKISALPNGSLNQIPSSCKIQGDVRLVPFYRMKQVKEVVERTVAELNVASLADAAIRGPDSHFAGGAISFEWLGDPIEGLACDLTSRGYHHLCSATEAIFGHVKPTADTGSLPLVADLKDAGFDVQTIGYGIEAYYHNDDEQARLSDFEKGYQVIVTVISALDKEAV